METLFDQHEEIVSRVKKLTVDCPRAWGRMNAGQMLAHCSVVLETAMGKHKPPRTVAGILIGSFLKKKYTEAAPFSLNSPTDVSFKVHDNRNFYVEKARLLDNIALFVKGGHENVTTHPHPFFGKLNSAQWARGMYKHLDHHLRQFNT